jgi:hypothetical protein
MGHYFVRVDNGKNVRRQVLESSKLCVYILKQEHRLAEIRNHKRAIIKHIRNELKELTFLLGTLEKELPVLTKKQLLEINPNAFKPAAKPKKEADKAPEELTKLHRLEHSLKLIEGRLEKL